MIWLKPIQRPTRFKRYSSRAPQRRLCIIAHIIVSVYIFIIHSCGVRCIYYYIIVYRQTTAADVFSDSLLLAACEPSSICAYSVIIICDIIITCENFDYSCTVIFALYYELV